MEPNTRADMAKLMLSTTQLMADGLGTDAPIPLHLIFLKIAAAGLKGETVPDQTELARQLGISTSAVSRHLANLGETHWLNRDQPGLRLVEVTIDMQDRRRRNLRLTVKGEKLIHQLTTKMQKITTTIRS